MNKKIWVLCACFIAYIYFAFHDTNYLFVHDKTKNAACFSVRCKPDVKREKARCKLKN